MWNGYVKLNEKREKLRKKFGTGPITALQLKSKERKFSGKTINPLASKMRDLLLGGRKISRKANWGDLKSKLKNTAARISEC